MEYRYGNWYNINTVKNSYSNVVAYLVSPFGRLILFSKTALWFEVITKKKIILNYF